MSVQVVRFSTDPGLIPEVEQAVGELFTALEKAAPAGLAYTAARVGEGGDFLLTLRLADDAVYARVAEVAVTRSSRLPDATRTLVLMRTDQRDGTTHVAVFCRSCGDGHRVKGPLRDAPGHPAT